MFAVNTRICDISVNKAIQNYTLIEYRSRFFIYWYLLLCQNYFGILKFSNLAEEFNRIPLTTLILTLFLALSALHSYFPASSKLMFDFTYCSLVVCCPSASVNASDVMVAWSLTCARLSLWYSWTLSWNFEENVQLILRSLPYRAHSSESGLTFKRDAEKYHENPYSVQFNRIYNPDLNEPEDFWATLKQMWCIFINLLLFNLHFFCVCFCFWSLLVLSCLILISFREGGLFVWLVGCCRSFLNTCPKTLSFLRICWAFYFTKKEIFESCVYK